MRFDRNAPGDGVEAACRLENGKAYLEWKLHLAEDGGEPGQYGVKSGDGRNQESVWKGQDLDGSGRGLQEIGETRREMGETCREAGAQVGISVTDEDGNVILECRQQLEEEEPLQSILLQPRLWRGLEDPYLYHVEAVLRDREGRCRDRIRTQLALRSLVPGQSGELALNGQALEFRAVRYLLPEGGGAGDVLGQMEKDLGLLRQLGANCVCLEGPWEEDADALCRDFLRKCDRLGFLAFGRERGGTEYIWIQDAMASAVRKGSAGEAEMPILRIQRRDSAMCGGDKSASAPGGRERAASSVPRLSMAESAPCNAERAFAGSGQLTQALLPDGECPGPLYYRYLAKWARQPFVHIVPESITRMESGNYTALCYSSCDRVALYSDGVLFEFQTGEGEFRFREIPARTPCIMLAAEGEGCVESLSVHKSFVKRWENEAIWH